MLSNSVLISWMIRAFHFFRKVIFVKIEFVDCISALSNYLCYIKKKEGLSIPLFAFVKFFYGLIVYVSATVSFDFAWAAFTISVTMFVPVLHVE